MQKVITMTKKSPHIVSRYLPVSIMPNSDAWSIETRGSALYKILEPFLMEKGGVWFGASENPADATQAELLASFNQSQSLKLEQVESAPVPAYISETLWPMFFDTPGQWHTVAEEWQDFVRYNTAFKDQIMQYGDLNNSVFVYDFDVLLVGNMLREAGYKGQLTYCHAAPFPAPHMFCRLPACETIIRSMCTYDLLGFQTISDRDNFIANLYRNFPGVERSAKTKLGMVFSLEGHEFTVCYSPMSVHPDLTVELANSETVSYATWFIKENFSSDHLAVGVVSDSPASGVGEFLNAVALSLEKHPDMLENIDFLQVVTPTRCCFDKEVYEANRKTLMARVERINKQFETEKWKPITLQFRRLPKTQRLALLRAADIYISAPLRETVDLTAKEAPFCGRNGQSVVLSSLSATCEQLEKGFLKLNPYNVEQYAETLYEAYSMPVKERRKMSRQMQQQIRRNDAQKWIDSFFPGP